jgi:hypothetical protein
MADIIFVAVAVAFFGLCVLYVRACDRLVRGTAEGPEAGADTDAGDTGPGAGTDADADAGVTGRTSGPLGVVE